jgi:hypothetical protein
VVIVFLTVCLKYIQMSLCWEETHFPVLHQNCDLHFSWLSIIQQLKNYQAILCEYITIALENLYSHLIVQHPFIAYLL